MLSVLWSEREAGTGPTTSRGSDATTGKERDSRGGGYLRPGIFAVRDARSGSVKRVASAVGEGSVCVQLIHRALREV